MLEIWSKFPVMAPKVVLDRVRNIGQCICAHEHDVRCSMACVIVNGTAQRHTHVAWHKVSGMAVGIQKSMD